MVEVQSKNRALGSQHDQSKATHKMEKKKKSSRTVPGALSQLLPDRKSG